MKNPWEWDESDLISLIENQVPEGLHLDYKQSEALDKSDTKKNDLSKDVAAFANSDGGTLVYGVVEDPTTHLPARLDDGYDPAIINKDWIEQVINSRIQRRISGVKITEINLSHAPGRVAYVVHVPQSLDAPHQSSDKKYYKRFNFHSVPMEDYEVRDVSRRFRTPSFRFDVRMGVIFQALNNPNDFAARATPQCSIFMTVVGNITARDLFVRIKADPPFKLPQYGNSSTDWRASGIIDGFHGLAANRPIHPFETVQIIEHAGSVMPIPASRVGFQYSLPSFQVKFEIKVYSQDHPPCIAVVDFADEDIASRQYPESFRFDTRVVVAERIE